MSEERNPASGASPEESDVQLTPDEEQELSNGKGDDNE